MNPLAEHGDAISAALSEQPVIVNPDFFVHVHEEELLRLRTMLIPFVRRPLARDVDRRVLCDSCLAGIHKCAEIDCPCACREKFLPGDLCIHEVFAARATRRPRIDLT